MVGSDRTGIAAGRPSFVTGQSIVEGSQCVLDQIAARHMRVLRLEAGAPIGLRDGVGNVAEGVLVRLAKDQAHVSVKHVEFVSPPSPLHLLVPVADRDRMLWLAEKACELACTSWRPVLWQRSKSVSPRGEGTVFEGKTRGRMASALVQSEGAWLPQIFPEASPEGAINAAPQGDRIALDPDGPPMVGSGAIALHAPITIALGPEGGFEASEIEALMVAGFRLASVGRTILRFETAGIAAMAVARTVLPAQDCAFERTP